MALIKFGTLGMITRAKNNARAVATVDMKNGYVFKVTDNYTAGGSKSKVDITVGLGTVADGTISFDIGGQTVYTAIVAATQTTAALVAAKIKTSLDAVLLGLGYTVAVTNAILTVTAPTNSASLVSVSVLNFNATTTTATFASVYTAGTDAATYSEAAEPIATDAEAKLGTFYIAMNIIDTPELWNYADFTITAGKRVNGNMLDNLVGYPLEMSSDLVVTPSGVSVGDYLVPVPAGSNQMLWQKASPTGYATCLQVVDITNFGGIGTVYGKGFECKLVTR